MAFHPQFQPLSADQGFLGGLGRGQEFVQNLLKFPQEQEARKLMNAIQAVNAKYAEPMAQGNLTKLNLENEWNPKRWASEIGLQGAQAGRLSKETQWYDKEAEAKIAAQKSLAGYHDAQAQKETMLLKQYMEAMNGNPQAAQQIESQNASSSGIPESNFIGNYGIPLPKPDREDIVNKNLFGMDTYSEKLKNAMQQREFEQKAYQEKLQNVNKAAADTSTFNRLLDSYNYWMDQGIATGPLGHYLPKFGTASQSVKNITAQMSAEGIQQVRQDMDSARFAVIDTKIALERKPDINWDAGTRKFYTEFQKGVHDRIQQQAQFYNVASAMKIPKEYADALWSNYQNQYPISNQAGNHVIKHEPDLWRKFLTPEAIESVNKKGSYTPISQKHVTNENVEDTMKKTGLKKEEVLDALEEKGFDVSHLRNKK